MSTKQSRVSFGSQSRRPALIGVDDIGDIIALLREDNERLLETAELLTARTESMRRSLIAAGLASHCSLETRSLKGLVRRPVHRSDASKLRGSRNTVEREAKWWVHRL
ncbi:MULTISPECIES: hypothetical protein [Bradyrhizobium]|uniref:hypothetical protein n=1 Tax=Bradyrhizobium TaxID=374 RepID=UPI0012FE22C8|nr:MULTISPECIES: hypothetical protein [Bradyrhizobium]